MPPVLNLGFSRCVHGSDKKQGLKPDIFLLASAARLNRLRKNSRNILQKAVLYQGTTLVVP
jgi:hypothetical protein